jgi:hypothetical protein
MFFIFNHGKDPKYYPGLHQGKGANIAKRRAAVNSVKSGMPLPLHYKAADEFISAATGAALPMHSTWQPNSPAGFIQIVRLCQPRPCIAIPLT